MAGDPRAGAHHVVTRVAVGLRPLIIGLARLDGLEGRGRGGGRVFGSRRLEGRGGLCGAGSLIGVRLLLRAADGACGGFVVRVLVPADFFFGGGS